MRLPFLVTLALLLSAFIRHAAHATPHAFSDDTCDDHRKVAAEFIEMELSGLRWQGMRGVPACLAKLAPETVYVDRVPASDPKLLNPEYLLPENRNVAFEVKKLGEDLLDVAMSYIGKRNKGDVAVKDHFVLRLNYGRTRIAQGCASWYAEPEHLVMRPRCWKN